MIKVILIILFFITGSFFGTWMNFRIPPPMLAVLEDVAANMWALDGLLPIQALFDTIYFILMALMFWFIFKVIWSAIGGGNDIN